MNKWIGNGMKEVIEILLPPSKISEIKNGKPRLNYSKILSYPPDVYSNVLIYKALKWWYRLLRKGWDLSCTCIALVCIFDFRLGWYTMIECLLTVIMWGYGLEWAAKTYNCLLDVLWFFSVLCGQFWSGRLPLQSNTVRGQCNESFA